MKKKLRKLGNVAFNFAALCIIMLVIRCVFWRNSMDDNALYDVIVSASGIATGMYLTDRINSMTSRTKMNMVGRFMVRSLLFTAVFIVIILVACTIEIGMYKLGIQPRKSILAYAIGAGLGFLIAMAILDGIRHLESAIRKRKAA